MGYHTVIRRRKSRALIINLQYEHEHIYCQARVQVPNPLSQQAPNPESKVRPSLKYPKTQFFGLG